jgi:hypothetical protein
VLELRRGAALVLGDVVDEGESPGTGGVSNGGRNRRVDLRRSPAIDGAIGAICGLIEGELALRRFRRGSGAGLVWEGKAEGVAIYRAKWWPWRSGRSSMAPAIQDAKGQGHGRRR